jgi:hypothetical protein
VACVPVEFWSVEPDEAPVPVWPVVPGALVLGLVCAGWLVAGVLVLGEEVCGVAAGLLCVCEEPELEGVLSGAVL